MTETEKKALEQAVAAAGRRMQDYAIMAEENVLRQSIVAHARAIEQHEAFKREVSDAVEKLLAWPSIRSQGIIVDSVAPFIIPKTDPLVEALGELADRNMEAEQAAETLRAAIEARGGRIVWEGE